MYKYKDKEFEIIEMTHEDTVFNWSLPRLRRPYIMGTDTARGRDQGAWDQFWRDNETWITNTVQGSGIYQQLRDSNPTTYGHITRESLEEAIDEVFTVREDTPRITRRRRSGMSAMASAVEIQRTIGIP